MLHQVMDAGMWIHASNEYVSRFAHSLNNTKNAHCINNIDETDEQFKTCVAEHETHFCDDHNNNGRKWCNVSHVSHPVETLILTLHYPISSTFCHLGWLICGVILNTCICLPCKNISYSTQAAKCVIIRMKEHITIFLED